MVDCLCGQFDRSDPPNPYDCPVHDEEDTEYTRGYVEKMFEDFEIIHNLYLRVKDIGMLDILEEAQRQILSTQAYLPHDHSADGEDRGAGVQSGGDS